MTLCFTRPEFITCPTCGAKPGSPQLCRECLERRELLGVVAELRRNNLGLIDRVLCSVWPPTGYHRTLVSDLLRICPTCDGWPKIECKEHGR